MFFYIFFFTILCWFSWFWKVFLCFFFQVLSLFSWFFMVLSLSLSTMRFFCQSIRSPDSGPMFLRFIDHRVWLFPMVANHRSSDAMFAMYRSSLKLSHAVKLAICQKCASRSTIHTSLCSKTNSWISAQFCVCSTVEKSWTKLLSHLDNHNSGRHGQNSHNAD